MFIQEALNLVQQVAIASCDVRGHKSEHTLQTEKKCFHPAEGRLRWNATPDLEGSMVVVQVAAPVVSSEEAFAFDHPQQGHVVCHEEVGVTCTEASQVV